MRVIVNIQISNLVNSLFIYDSDYCDFEEAGTSVGNAAARAPPSLLIRSNKWPQEGGEQSDVSVPPAPQMYKVEVLH